LPPGSTLDTTSDNPSRLELVTDVMGFGWWPADAEAWENVHLTDFVDYPLPSSVFSTTAPELRYEKAAADVLSLVEVNMVDLGGSNSVRGQPLTFFSFDDGADEFFDAYFEVDYFAVAWVGSAEPVSSMTWRAEGGAQPYQVIHWWNHGFGDQQTITATLYAADGSVRSSGQSVFVWPGNSNGNIGFTSFISVYPVEATDYLIIENKGTNVGWRATAVYFLEDSGNDYSLYPLNPDSEGIHTDEVFGSVRVFSPEWGDSELVGPIQVAAYPWLFHAHAGWLMHVSGDFMSGMYLYSESLGWLYAQDALDGHAYRYATREWVNLR